MLKRVVTAAVGVVGLVLVGLGVASATLWRADEVLVATASGGAHTYVTDPGVLEMGGDPATVRITAPAGAHVVLAVGRDTDVAGWIGSDAHARVTGLASWHELATTTAAPTSTSTAGTSTAGTTSTAAPSPVPTASATAGSAGGGSTTAGTAADPTGSDMWVQEASGNGSASLTWQAQPGRWSLIAVSTGAAPTLSISWPRVVTTPWLWPLVVVGLLLALGAAAVFFWDELRRRRGPDADWTPVTTGAIPAVEGEPTVVLTRRQLREAAQARTARPRTDAIPIVTEPGTTADGVRAGEPTAVTTGGAPNTATRPDSPSRAQPDGTSTTPPLLTPTGSASTGWVPAGAPPTTRRALRAATGAIPTVAPRGGAGDPTAVQPPAHATGARRPAADDPTAAQPAVRATDASVAPGSAPSASPRSVPSAPPTSVPSAGPAPVPSAGPAPISLATPHDTTTPTPAEPTHARPAWLPVPGGPAAAGRSPAATESVSAAVPADPRHPAATVPDGPSPATPPVDGGQAHHPRWLGTRTVADAAPPASQVLPPPGPQRGDGPSGIPSGTADEPETSGSRADAWRRAWGLPPVERDDSAQDRTENRDQAGDPADGSHHETSDEGRSER